jgi:hypothetical protein
MTVESASFISQLNENYPEVSATGHATDDHLRLIKSAIANTFVDLVGEVSVSAGELNALVGMSGTVLDRLGEMSASLETALSTSLQETSASLESRISELSASCNAFGQVPVCVAYRDTTQSSASLYFYALPTNTSVDTHSMHTGTAVVIPAGVTAVNIAAAVNVSNKPGQALELAVALYKNGSNGDVGELPLEYYRDFTTSPSTVLISLAMDMISCTAGDEFSLFLNGLRVLPHEKTGIAMWMSVYASRFNK